MPMTVMQLYGKLYNILRDNPLTYNQHTLVESVEVDHNGNIQMTLEESHDNDN